MTGTAPFYADVASAPDGVRTDFLITEDGTRIRAAQWAGGMRGTVVIFPGRTEYIEKYGRVIASLTKRGFAVAAIDWRGQGLSDRPAKNPQLGHVETFSHYQQDVRAYLDWLSDIGTPKPFWLLAHSMGGCIGLRTLIERRDFVAAAMSAPMWRLQMCMALCELAQKLVGSFRPGGTGSTASDSAGPEQMAVPFEQNVLTTDRDIYQWHQQQITTHPDLALGSPSMGWNLAALREMTRLGWATMPDIPVLAFYATDEALVSNAAIVARMARMSNGQAIELDGAKHEILMERPGLQAEIWSEMDRFFDSVESRISSV